MLWFLIIVKYTDLSSRFAAESMFWAMNHVVVGQV